MVQTVYLGYLYIHAWEWIALPSYLFFIFLFAYRYQRAKKKKNLLYRYFVPGLFVKIFGGIFFVAIYIYYYQGGDTTAYFESAMALKNLLFTSPMSYFQNEFGKASMENWYLFSADTGYPLLYMFKDPQTYMVVRLVNPLLIPAFDSYLLTTILLDCITYAGMWRLFLVFCDHYPKKYREFALAILFFPSVIFWGGGILKDPITLSSSGWVIYCIHKVFIKKEGQLKYSFLMLLNLTVIFLIKPYIIFSLLPGSLMWIFSRRIYAIKNVGFKLLVIPLILLISVAGAYVILNSLSQYMGKFALSNITHTAIVTQNDLKQDYYRGHSFDIGLTDQSLTGFIKKSPEAVMDGIYRPFIWECANIIMLLSGLETTLIIFLTLLSLYRSGLFPIIGRIFKEPLLFFSISYSIFFAFSVGITTSNFGALVRFKIAYLPFFICAMFILVQKIPKKIGNKSFAPTR